jgi:plastocyanin
MRKLILPLVGITILAAPITAPATAQETLERTTNLSGGWTGDIGTLYANVPFRLSSRSHLQALPTFDLALGLPRELLAGARYASPGADWDGAEWELYLRRGLLRQARGQPVDVAVDFGYDGSARALAGELSLARWMGPLRLLGGVRGFAPVQEGNSRLALAGGAVFHPFERHLPLALVADVASFTDTEAAESLAWSAGVQLGVSFSPYTVALFATNTRAGTLLGSSAGDEQVRYGFEITLPIPVGRLLGWPVPREQARESVREVPSPPGELVIAELRRYLFAPKRIEVEKGTTVEWVNLDDVVHTVDADDGSWRSGAIQPGASWRAVFDRPGLYPYHCGPHPFMRGVVIVR